MIRREITVSGLSVVLLAATASFAQDEFGKCEWSKPPAPLEKKRQTVKGTLRFDTVAKEVQFLGKGGAGFIIKYEAVTGLVYELTKKPRYAEAILLSPLFLLTSRKAHYLTIQYTDPATGTGEFALVKLHKSNYQAAVATAETKTGKKAVRAIE